MKTLILSLAVTLAALTLVSAAPVDSVDSSRATTAQQTINDYLDQDVVSERLAELGLSQATHEQRLAKLAHLALYGLMIGLPLLGWLTLSAAGKPIPFFGLELPALLSPDKNLAGDIKEIHETVAELGYWLIGLHAAAALFHHYVRRDDVLRRMLPQRQS